MEVTCLRTLCDVSNEFQNVKIIDTQEFGRALLIDGVMQGSETDHSLYDSELLRNLSSEDERVLILGGGDGFIADTILTKHPGIKEIHVVDIDHDVVFNCNKYFKRSKNYIKKVNFLIEDAVRFLEDLDNDTKYSAIIFDLTEIPIVTDDGGTKSFFEKLFVLAAPHVSEDGWISIQAGTPTVSSDYFDLSDYLTKLIAEKYPIFEKISKFIPCFGEEASFISIKLKQKFVYDLSDKVIHSNKDILGGKGYSLHEMIKSGIPIPEAFVVSANSYEYFTDFYYFSTNIKNELEKLHDSSDEQIKNISRNIKKFFLKKALPPQIKHDILNLFSKKNFNNVAVRSSATLEDGIDNAWAGQLDTFLNVKQSDLEEKIIECFASLFSERSLTYIKENNLIGKNIKVAVVVQELINADVSGVAFSANPLSNNLREIVVESIFGLGEFLVGGVVTPDYYVLDKKSLKILTKKIVGQKVKLVADMKNCGGVKEIQIDTTDEFVNKMADDKYVELARLVVKCENYFGCPQDVEWCIKDDKFQILQSRPITTVNKSNIPNLKDFVKIYTVENIFPPLFIDLAVHSKYLNYDGLFVFENYSTTLYFEKKAFKRANSYGAKKILEGDYLREARKKMKLLNGELVNLKKLIKRVKRIEDLDAFFDAYVRSFSVALREYSYTEYFYTNGAEQKLNSMLKKELGKEYYNSIIYELLSKNKPDHKIRFSRGLVVSLMNLKNAGEEKLLFRLLMNDLASLYGIFIKKFSKYFVASDEFFDHLLLSEAQGLLAGEHSIKDLEEMANSRRENYALYLKNKNEFRYSVEEAKNISDYFHNIDRFSNTGTSFKGHGVYSGYYSGKIRKVPYFMDTDDKEFRAYVRRFQNGDILLARSTGPELLPIIKRAGAIIAEEGGIMSHAAVVCREFKKPGVVGIPNVFEVLKEGQYVFVDGQSGMVIIENDNEHTG